MAFITIVGRGGFITKFFWMLITLLTLGVDGKLVVRDDATYNVASSAFIDTGKSIGVPTSGQMMYLFTGSRTPVYAADLAKRRSAFQRRRRTAWRRTTWKTKTTQ